MEEPEAGAWQALPGSRVATSQSEDRCVKLALCILTRFICFEKSFMWVMGRFPRARHGT